MRLKEIWQEYKDLLERQEAALLAIRMLDPACGSGHFLLAAARRLALELAHLRAGDEEPSEDDAFSSHSLIELQRSALIIRR